MYADLPESQGRKRCFTAGHGQYCCRGNPGDQSMGWQIYDEESFRMADGRAAALAGAVWQTAKLIKRMGGNVDEINIGTIV